MSAGSAGFLHHLHTAAAQLSGTDAALIPGLDGGYVLLGLRRFHPALFHAVPWSICRRQSVGNSGSGMTLDHPQPGAAPGLLDSIQVVIPVRDEEHTLAHVIAQLQGQGLRRIRVVDNGSRDRSAAIARRLGVEVLSEPTPGYGRACWQGCRTLDPATRWLLFCDGDGGDPLEALPRFLELLSDHDLLLGDRTATAAGRAALTPLQRWGNRVATGLIALGWGFRYRDLGPLRLVRRSAFEAMGMRDRGYGWTLEMQVRAIELGLRIREVPIPHRPRLAGHSKISGRWGASLRAGCVILTTLGRLRLRQWT